MNWMFYILGATAIGAVGLALYERKKNLRLRMDQPQEPHDRDRSAYVHGEQMRAEATAKQMPTSGGFF